MEKPEYYVNLEDYIKKFVNENREISELEKKLRGLFNKEWDFVKYVARDTKLFNKFLKRVRVGIRIKAAVYANFLKLDTIKKHMGIPGIETFASIDFDPNKKKAISKNLLKLAIILDLPLSFIWSDDHKKNNNLFLEYDFLNVKEDLLKDILIKEMSKPDVRQINGYRFINTQNNNRGIIRLDKHPEFYVLELYIGSEFNIEFSTQKEIENSLKNLMFVYETETTGQIRTSYRKVCFAGLYFINDYLEKELIDFVQEMLKRDGSRLVLSKNIE